MLQTQHTFSSFSHHTIDRITVIGGAGHHVYTGEKDPDNSIGPNEHITSCAFRDATPSYTDHTHTHPHTDPIN